MVDEVIDESRRAFLGSSALVLSTVVVSGSVLTAGGCAHSAAVHGPAVIGYPNEKGVMIERVTYPARNMGTTVVANLFKPAGFDFRTKFPGSW